MDTAKPKTIQSTIVRAFLSAEQIILINWKKRKPYCFSMKDWHKDFMEFLSMEQAASTIVGDNRLAELWVFFLYLSPQVHLPSWVAAGTWA